MFRVAQIPRLRSFTTSRASKGLSLSHDSILSTVRSVEQSSMMMSSKSSNVCRGDGIETLLDEALVVVGEDDLADGGSGHVPVAEADARCCFVQFRFQRQRRSAARLKRDCNDANGASGVSSIAASYQGRQCVPVPN